MSDNWFFKKDGKKLGPVSSGQLKQLAHDGQLQPTDLIWKEGMKDWWPASKLPGVFGSREGRTNSPTQQPICQAAPPITATAAAVDVKSGIASFNDLKRLSTAAKVSLAAVGVLTISCVLCCGGLVAVDRADHSGLSSSSPSSTDDIPTFTVKEFFQTVKSSEEAKEKYQGKRLRLIGRLESLTAPPTQMWIDGKWVDETILKLGASGSPNGVFCKFHTEVHPTSKNVSIEGLFDGMSFKQSGLWAGGDLPPLWLDLNECVISEHHRTMPEPDEAPKGDSRLFTTAGFFETLNSIKQNGRIEPSNGLYNAVFRSGQFKETFGEPQRDVSLMDDGAPMRLWSYRCSDGVLHLTVQVGPGYVFLQQVDRN